MFHSFSKHTDSAAAGKARAEDVRRQIVIAPHHPDRLRRPSPRAGGDDEERFLHTLTWNVFRTLELLPPAFWLRRLHARLRGEAPGAAGQTVDVGLWRPLPLPPAQRIDGGRPDIVVDVIIETEYAVWCLMTATANDLRWFDCDPNRADTASAMVAAASWFAGTRDCHIGVIQSTRDRTLSAGAFGGRFSRSRDSLWLRAGHRPGSLGNVHGVGLLRWTQLASVLQDCAQATVLTDIERALARNALSWLGQVEIQPP